MAIAYLVEVERERKMLGQENPLIRIVQANDLDDFFYEHVGKTDSVTVRQVEMYKPCL